MLLTIVMRLLPVIEIECSNRYVLMESEQKIAEA